MNDFTNFVTNLLAPSLQKSQTAQQSYRPPVQQQTQPKRGFFDKLLDTISPYLAPIQKFIESPKSTKIVPEFKTPQKANIGTQLGYGLANLPGSLVNAVIGKGIVDPAIDVGRFVGNTITGKELPKYETLKSGASKLGLQLGSKLTGQKLAPQNIQSYLSNTAGAAEPILNAYVPKAGLNIAAAPTKTIANKVLTGAVGGGGYGGLLGLAAGVQENEYSKNVGEQLLRSVPSTATGAAFGAVLGGGAGAIGGIFDAMAGKTAKQLGLTKQEATDLTIKYFRNDLGQFTTKDKAVTGLKQNVVAQINRKLGKPIDSPVFTSDLHKALGYSPREVVESRIGLQARPTGNIGAAQSALDSKLPIANKQSAGVAVLESMSGNPKKTGFAALPKNLQNSFQDLVNGRSASNVVQKKVAQQFRALDRDGVQDLIDFSKGVDRPGFKQARDYLDNIHTYLRQQGFDVNYKENYLTGAYQESAQEVEKVFRKLGLNPSFTKESLFKNYEEAIAAGLTPRFNKLSDLIGYYSGRVNNAVANKTIWKQLTEQGLIRSKPEVGWTRLDPGAFPGQGFKFVNEAGEIVTHSGSSYAPDDLAQALNNYFKRPEGNLEKVANFSSTVKNIILSSGIPKTGINFHGFTTLFRTGFSPKAAGYLLKPSAADNFIKGNLNKLEFFVRKGLKATTEEHAFQDAFRGVAGKSLFSKSLNKVIKVHQVLFEDPLFQKVLPALKLQKAESIYKNLLKSGMGADDAAREAAKQANSFFGGINWEQMGRSRDFQNILRSVFLAPDLLESQLQLGKGIGKGLLNPRDPRGKAYRDFMRTFILSYIALNLANKETTGKWAFENPTGHAFELKVGDTYIRPYASGADFIRLPVDFANALVQKDIDSAWDVVRNRISSPAQAATQIASATDRFGNPLFNNKYTGKPLPIQQQLAGIAGVGGNLGIPSYAQAGINVATGRSTLGKGIVQGLELPVRFAPKPKAKSKTRSRGYSRR